jgi:hypothetical protein
VRNLRSRNAVPAFYARGGFTTLVGAELVGIGSANGQPAIICESGMMARDVRTRGYKMALQSRIAGRDGVSSANFEQWLSKPASSLFGAPGAGLRLPVRETPTLPWDDAKTWVSPQKFGAKANDDADDSAAIQQAIDSGATTVYLPRGSYNIGSTVVIRGKVRRIIGCKAFLQMRAPLSTQDAPMFRFQDGVAPVVVVEGLHTDFSSGPFYFMGHQSRRTLVMSRLAINFQGADAYRGEGSGTVFIEDVVGRWFKFRGQAVWARQFNVEGDGTHILNDGGTMWILGYKTEGYGTLLHTRNGGTTELLGGLSYTVGDEKQDAPMFIVDNARLAASFCEVNFTNSAMNTIVRETRDGQTKDISKDDPRWGRYFALFTAAY